MSKQSRAEIVQAVRRRYQQASRAEKGRIVDEFVALTGYHRKHALRLLCAPEKPQPPSPSSRAPRARIYDEAVQQALIVVWEAADRLCGKRLKAGLPWLVESMERHGHLRLESTVRARLLAMSPATIDRLLTPARRRASGTRKRKNNHTLKNQIPVRTFGDWGDAEPGYFEADFVVHSGGSMRGSPVHSFVLTDVSSGWTEAVPLIVREQTLVVEALRVLQTQLPVPLVGIDTDNDGAFINESLLCYCKENGIKQTRARAHQKNDQAWIEQKNGAVVRRLIGYDRFEGTSATQLLARLYGVARLYVNFFQPSFKLLSKRREGAKVKKTYHPPATPCDRLLVDARVPDSAKELLRIQRAELDPVALLHQIRELQGGLALLAGRASPETVEETELDQFLKALPTLWKAGEVRPTHKDKPKPARTWRTRVDPFEGVWPELEQHLRSNPAINGKDLFLWLCERHPGVFKAGQLRTLQRKLQAWRAQEARLLILPHGAKGPVDEWITGAASGNISS